MAKEKNIDYNKRVRVKVIKLVNDGDKAKTIPVIWNGKRFEIMYNKEVKIPLGVIDILETRKFPVYDEEEKKVNFEKKFQIVVLE